MVAPWHASLADFAIVTAMVPGAFRLVVLFGNVKGDPVQEPMVTPGLHVPAGAPIALVTLSSEAASFFTVMSWFNALVTFRCRSMVPPGYSPLAAPLMLKVLPLP